MLNQNNLATAQLCHARIYATVRFCDLHGYKPTYLCDMHAQFVQKTPHAGENSWPEQRRSNNGSQ